MLLLNTFHSFFSPLPLPLIPALSALTSAGAAALPPSLPDDTLLTLSRQDHFECFTLIHFTFSWPAPSLIIPGQPFSLTALEPGGGVAAAAVGNNHHGKW